MKKLILNVFVITFIAFLYSNSAFAGIPIQEKVTEQVVVNKKIKKSSKLNQHIAKKLVKKIAKKDDGGGNNKILSVILAILIPFVGIAVWQNGITKDFWITLILTILGFLPGLIYALYKILS